MNGWNALYLIAGIIELGFGIATLFKPSYLFPGINAAGNLAAKWFGMAICVLGIACLRVIGYEDTNDNKLTIDLVMLCYNLGIACMTIIRLKRGMQVDGPNTTLPMSCCKSESTQNTIKGLLGAIFIHGGLVVCFSIHLSEFNHDLTVFIWNIVTPLIVTVLSIVTSFLADAAPDSVASPISKNMS